MSRRRRSRIPTPPIPQDQLEKDIKIARALLSSFLHTITLRTYRASEDERKKHQNLLTETVVNALIAWILISGPDGQEPSTIIAEVRLAFAHMPETGETTLQAAAFELLASPNTNMDDRWKKALHELIRDAVIPGMEIHEVL